MAFWGWFGADRPRTKGKRLPFSSISPSGHIAQFILDSVLFHEMILPYAQEYPYDLRGTP